MPDKKTISSWFKSLQDDICQGLEQLDGQAKFEEDLWTREAGGGGRTRVISNGDLIEKGGVNFSEVHGPTPQNILKALNLPESDFFATGLSIVLHPENPNVPIIHMNVRYFEMSTGDYWFGGGIDLTPHYVDQTLAGKFHRKLKSVCDEFSADHYSEFKQWADDYFFIKHRKETRGIGGIFFDRLKADGTFTKADRWDFVKAVGEAFIPLYTAQAVKTRSLPVSEQQKQWQGLRRGRYVEFNLVWDKGTKFGLDTDGRTESILMSLPPVANWAYDHTPEPNSEELKTVQSLKKGINWIDHD